MNIFRRSEETMTIVDEAIKIGARAMHKECKRLITCSRGYPVINISAPWYYKKA